MTRPVNVLYLIRTWALGGSHTIIRLLKRHLPRERFNVVVVPYDAPGTGDADFIASMEREGLDVAPERIPWRSRRQWFAARAKVDELVARYNIDLIHAHDTQSIVLVGLHRARWTGATVASPYGWWEPRWHLQARGYHWVERQLALPRFDRVITVSQDMKAKVMQGPTPGERVQVIHTGLDVTAFEGGAAREAVRAALELPDDAVVVGTVSRLFKEKGHTYLLQACARLAEDIPPLRLLIVGTGDQLDALRAQAQALGIADRVLFTGFYADLPGALRAMDIFAQPSILHEGFPTSVLEAQVMGLPVIASDIGGTRETMAPGETGLLVPPRKVGALAEAVRQLAERPELRRKMAAAARPFVTGSFTLEQMLAQVVDTYEAALAQAPGTDDTNRST